MITCRTIHHLESRSIAYMTRATMAPRLLAARCGKCLIVGLLAAAAVSVLLAVRGTIYGHRPLAERSRVDRVADAAGRPPLLRPGPPDRRGSDNSSAAVSEGLLRLQGKIAALEARLAARGQQGGGAVVAEQPRDGNNGQPLSGNSLQAIRKLTKYPFAEDPQYNASTCPKTISSLALYSKWFKDRYRPRIKVFLDGADVDKFDSLSRYVLPFGFSGESRELVQSAVNHPAFVNAPLHPSGSRRQCLQCAVVGCGGILKDSRAGAEIDSHDYVFRLNHAVTSGRFEKDVGRRTSFYTFFPESMGVATVFDKDARFIYAMFKSYDVHYAVNMFDQTKPQELRVNGQTYILPKPSVDPAKVKIIHPDFFRYVFSQYLNGVSYRPTTGAMVVFLALHMCDEVTIYGFGYDPRFTMHYYDNGFVKHSDQSTGSHDVDNERQLWARLHEEGVLRLFKRDL